MSAEERAEIDKVLQQKKLLKSELDVQLSRAMKAIGDGIEHLRVASVLARGTDQKNAHVVTRAHETSQDLGSVIAEAQKMSKTYTH